MDPTKPGLVIIMNATFLLMSIIKLLSLFDQQPSYEKFQQRYLINDTFWGGAKHNAPIFVYTGNEGDIGSFAQNTGFMFDVAPHFKALLVFIEVKVSSCGHWSFGVFENITSPYNFYNTVTQDFRSESENCYKVIKDSWRQLEDAAKRPGGLDLLRKSFRTCKEISSVDDVVHWISQALVYTAMTDYPTPSNFLASLPAYPVKQMCNSIDDPKTGNDTLAKLLGAASVYYNNTGSATCFNLINTDSDDDSHVTYMWQWQSCTEMIMPMARNKDSVLGESLAWNYDDEAVRCKAIYDVEPRRNWVVDENGGQDINRVLKRYGSNIIFFNGLRDPWSGGGVLKNISDTIIAIVAEHGAHHVDLRFSNEKDPPWLRNVRKQEVNIIAKWIAEYYYDLALS
ncbi:hypothetical protein ACFE04_020562 [Oxalis oulophora]